MNSHLFTEEKGKAYFKLLNRIFEDENDVLAYNLIDPMDLVDEIDRILKEIEEKPSRPMQKNSDANIRIKNILVWRYGLASGNESMTLLAIAKELEISRGRVGQIEYQGLTIMRKHRNINRLKKFRNIEVLQNS